MHLIPTESEVIDLLHRTGALRDGHFECLNNLHTNKYLDVALAMRSYCHAKTLSVGLSRVLRDNPELRPVIPELSLVAVTTGGLPIAYGLCEALRARQVYWSEKEDRLHPMHLRQYLEPEPGEKIILVDDILRAGRLMAEARALLEARGAQVLGLAVAVHQPTPHTVSFGALPIYQLAELKATYYSDGDRCDLCARGVPLERRSCHGIAIAAT